MSNRSEINLKYDKRITYTIYVNLGKILTGNEEKRDNTFVEYSLVIISCYFIVIISYMLII